MEEEKRREEKDRGRDDRKREIAWDGREREQRGRVKQRKREWIEGD